MEVFGIIGMSFGTMGFVFALNALAQAKETAKELSELKTRLHESGNLDETE